MTLILPAVLVAIILSGPGSVQPEDSPCDPGGRHIELPAVPNGQAPKVCISPGRATLFSFDSDLLPGSVTLEGAERFTRVEPGQSTLELLPSVKVAAGERLRLTVTFKDNTAPTSAAFLLVMQAVQAEPLVNVYRQVRSAESYEQELEETKAKVRRLTEENTRLRAEKGGPGGLIGLRASGALDDNGVSFRNITKSITKDTANVLEVSGVSAYHSSTRAVVEVRLGFPENAPTWKPEGASLTHEGKKGVELKIVTLWPSESLAPGVAAGTVSVEAEAPPDVATGTFMLKLWDASGARTVTLRGITFP